VEWWNSGRAKRQPSLPGQQTCAASAPIDSPWRAWDEAGATVIELWELEDVSAPIPVRATGGGIVDPEVRVPATRRTRVFSCNVAGKRYVNHMCRFLGRADQLFVEFLDSRDVNALNVRTEELELVASPRAPPRSTFPS